MKLGLAQYTSVEIERQGDLITNFSDEIEKYFVKYIYGDDLIDVVIGVVCVSPNFEQFFKPKKPKYTKEKKLIKSEGFEYEIEKCLEYSIILDFDMFKNSSDDEAKKYLSKEILKSLDTIESMKSKIKDFDLISFKKDLENYFKEKGFL